MLQSNANVSSVRTVNSRTATGSTMNGCHKNIIVELQMDLCVQRYPLVVELKEGIEL